MARALLCTYRFLGFHNLASCCLGFITSLVVVFCVYQFTMISEFQIIHFKHQLKEKRLAPDQFNSTCSCTADLLGPHQKVIAYSIYGDFSRVDVVRKYLQPFKETLKRIPSIYPGSIRCFKYLSFNRRNFICTIFIILIEAGL
jgi:hypothetical protein